MLQDAAPGIHALTDFRWLESMPPSTAPHIAEIMDALAEKQVASVIRVIPDPGKDIGMNILSRFHYSRELSITTVETLVDALDILLQQDSEPAERKEDLELARRSNIFGDTSDLAEPNAAMSEAR